MRSLRLFVALMAVAAGSAVAHAGPVALAPNDDCAHATDISAGGTFTGDDVLALDDYRASDGSGAFAADVVFTFALGAPSQAVVDLGRTDYQVDVYVRTACEDPASEVAFFARAGGVGVTPFDTVIPQDPPPPLRMNLGAGRYYLILDSDNGAGVPYRFGDYAMTFSTRAPIAGDRCEDPFALAAGAETSGTLADMVDDYRTRSAGAGGRDVAFAVTLAEPRTLQLDTAGSTFDTVLYARAVCDDPSTEFAVADDNGSSLQARLDVALPAGTSYVILDGWDRSASGSYVVSAR